MSSKFKDNYSFEKRENVSSRIRKKYPERVPLIVERSITCDTLEEIDKHKYLVPCDLTVGQMLYVIRKRIKGVGSEQALFIFIGDIMPSMGESIAVLYNKYKDDDGFLYLTYSGENTFG